jgi:hypothetical protein
MLCCAGQDSCPLVGGNETALSLREAAQTRHLCDVFSPGKLIGSILLSGFTAGASVWAYVWLLSTRRDPRQIPWYMKMAMGCASCVCGIILAILVYNSQRGRVNLASSGAEMGLLALALPVQFLIAALWHTQRHRCRRAASSVTSRLWRGAAIPILAVVATCPAASIAMAYHHHSTAVFTLTSDAGVDVVWLSLWLIMSVGVLALMVPLAAVVGRVYLPRHVPSQDLLTHNGIYRGELFLWAHKGYAQLSGLLFVLFWIPYMANELQVFCSSISKSVDTTSAGVSADGIRALGPIVVVLNGGAIMGFWWAIALFPAPDTFSPFVFVGMGWGAFVSFCLTTVTLMLVWAVSDPKVEAVQQHNQAIEKMRVDMLRTSFTTMLEDKPSRLRRILQFVTSWQGQTAFSTVNHLCAIAMFCYGASNFSEEMRGTEIRPWLMAGIVLSCTGMIASLGSLLERKYPQLKITPTDDSFRIACLLKVALVMTKAMIVFLLAGIRDKSASFEQWEDIVSAICFVSLAILALMTAAYTVRKVWSKPELLESAGVHSPRTFLLLYAVSYVCSKFATIFFMAQGHLPNFFGCNEDLVTFNASKQFGLNPHSEAISCSLCYPTDDTAGSNSSSALAAEVCHASHELYYACSTSCIQLFYDGDPSGLSLVVFVLIPLLWLPFAVYANNESAQLIDGTWWRYEQSQTNSRKTASVKIGLSSTADGYYTIAPLVQAVTIACGVILMCFVASTNGGYQISVPTEVLAALGERGTALQRALFHAGRSVTVCAVVLNVVMMSRVAVEVFSVHAYRATMSMRHSMRRLGGSIRGQEMLELLRSAEPSTEAVPHPTVLRTGM